MSDNLCGLCQNNEGKYICPTCSVFYCSVACYRSEQHLECSEIFYRKCVEEELKSKKYSSTNEIVSVLKRTKNNFSDEPLNNEDDNENEDGDDENSDEEHDDKDKDEGENENYDDDDDNVGNDESEKDSDDDEDIAVRMKNVDLDDSDMLWQKLTLEERKDFLNLVSTGEIRTILPEWTPWWKFYKKKLIIDIEAENESNIEDTQCPIVDTLIPPLSEITKKTPSENIPFIMVNILLAYAYTARWFKGKHCDMPVEGITTLSALSAALRSNKVFEGLVEAFAEFENDLHNCPWLAQDVSTSELIWEDVIDIVNGSKGEDFYFSLKASICDIHDMIQKALKILRDTGGVKCFTGPEPTLLHLKLLSKKMSYYLSWITSYGQLLQNKVPLDHA